jgi:hypothetical protein
LRYTLSLRATLSLREGAADEAISIEQCAHNWLGIASSLRSSQ